MHSVCPKWMNLAMLLKRPCRQLALENSESTRGLRILVQYRIFKGPVKFTLVCTFDQAITIQTRTNMYLYSYMCVSVYVIKYMIPEKEKSK